MRGIPGGFLLLSRLMQLHREGNFFKRKFRWSSQSELNLIE